jgi:hypothetical protein
MIAVPAIPRYEYTAGYVGSSVLLAMSPAAAQGNNPLCSELPLMTFNIVITIVKIIVGT